MILKQFESRKTPPEKCVQFCDGILFLGLEVFETLIGFQYIE